MPVLITTKAPKESTLKPVVSIFVKPSWFSEKREKFGKSN